MEATSASTAPAPAVRDPAAAAQGIELDGTLPEDNALYKRREYWDARFKMEEAYEWLVAYDDVKGLLAPYLPPHDASDARILVLGCGNSDFSSQLLEALRARGGTGGTTVRVVSLDYSAVVIEKMRAKHQVGLSNPIPSVSDNRLLIVNLLSSSRAHAHTQGELRLEWVEHDMRALPERFEAGSFDLVVDKAGTDGTRTQKTHAGPYVSVF